MTGIPVVSIGPEHMTIFGPDLFEGHELVNPFPPGSAISRWFVGTDVGNANRLLGLMLKLDGAFDPSIAPLAGARQREHAVALFGRETVGADWKAFLG